ncbi:hypothetical protein CYY_008398 [Polysphondylium violaceum]|uniref:Uncharacterized protein n=1 Tax=Polysphondylium violaceum TaxID=133409 RepID=A0A8J4PQG5_9MYCE|nr:hypothetical protein CYY_008398 [Polysphondylium violaceum]
MSATTTTTTSTSNLSGGGSGTTTDLVKIYYFISRFLDNDSPNVTSNFKEFLAKEGFMEMLITFITLSYPKTVQDEIDRQKAQGNNSVQSFDPNQSIGSLATAFTSSLSLSTGSLSNSLSASSSTAMTNSLLNNGTPIEVIKSYRVMDLFLHPSTPFISLSKDKLSVIVSSLFEIFKNLDSNYEPKGNLYHFARVLQCLFFQFPFELLQQLSEIQTSSQKSYFQLLSENIYFTPIQDFFLGILKRASVSVSEYQTSNPIDTKKIQKVLQKSKVFNMISNFFLQPETLDIKKEKMEIVLEGFSDFIILVIEELDLHGPDTGIPIFCFQNKEFVDGLIRIMSENRKHSFEHRTFALRILSSFSKQSLEYTNNNNFQLEKDSIFSPSGPSSWISYLSTYHQNTICKIMIDIGNDSSLKKKLSTYRMDTLDLLVEMIKSKQTFKRKTPNQPYLPVELWYFLVDWFFIFNNIFHSKFFDLIKELFLQGHVPSMKHFCNFHLKRFLLFYKNPEEPTDCKGIILLICNFIRISATRFPASHFLPTFLHSNELWNSTLPLIISDTLKNYIGPDAKDDTTVIAYGSDFAKSIGFEDENSKKSTNNKALLIDEFAGGNNNATSSNVGSSSNGNGASFNNNTPEDIARIEKELLMEEEASKKKKKNQNKKKK